MNTNIFYEKYDYNNKEFFSKGSFGQIYKIKDKNIKTEYILKEINKKDSFKIEKNSLIDIKGTNIINIFDYYENENENCYYLILEKMDGDLNKMIEENYKNGMSSKLIRKIFFQINSGLKIMRDKKKVHRDLKPSNILFSYTNDKKTDFIVKIGDFGLTKNLESIKKTSLIVGTPFFIAPELLAGNFSDKCDLYSIGVILYVLKTGDINCGSLIDFIVNLNNNTIKNETDDEKLNSLIKNLVVSNPKNRMEWEKYFEDPFFKVNDEEECKIKY